MLITPDWLETQLNAVKAAYPEGITREEAEKAGIGIIQDAVEEFEGAVEEAEKAQRLAAARKRMADAIDGLRDFRPAESGVAPIDISALVRRRLQFRDTSRANIHKDLAPTRAVVNIGFGVLAAAVPIVMSGGASSPAALAGVLAPLTGTIMDFVNN